MSEAQLPTAAEVTRFVSDAIRAEYAESGEIAATVRKLRGSLAENWNVEEARLKEQHGQLIKKVAEETVAGLESVGVAGPSKHAGEAETRESESEIDDGHDLSSLETSSDETGNQGKGRARHKAASEANTKTKQKAIKQTKAKVSRNNDARPPPGKADLDPQNEEVQKLKKLVVACGVRKMWSKYFASLEPPAETTKLQIAALRSLLSELGMGSRPSMAKAKEIKAKREFEDEIRSIGIDRQGTTEIDSDTAERSSRARRRKSGGGQPDKSDRQSGSDSQGEEDEGALPKKKPRLRADLAAFAAGLNSDDDE